MSKPLILVTNDDGMFAPGIHNLIDVARRFGEVVVVAPNSPQSAKGHAITIEDPLRLNKVDVFDGLEAYECSGTPVDCVKLAKNVILKDRKVDLCLSGINHGSNASINIIYSGTLSAAMEASIEGIPSIGFSLLDYSLDADFRASRVVVEKMVDYALTEKIKGCMLLNVNIPRLPYDQIKGFRVCRQSEGNWREEFIEASDPRGQNYYWLTGRFETEDLANDTDLWALENGYVSVVPSGHDLTIHGAIAKNTLIEKL